jgi:hypothetical protein
MLANKICPVITLLIFSLILSCAFDVIRVKQEPAKFEPNAPEQGAWTLGQNIEVSLDTGYKRELKAGTRWRHIGKIENGDVYETNDQILTVEGSNIHEACIVVTEGYLVGFYLLGNQTFSPLSSKKLLSILK